MHSKKKGSWVSRNLKELSYTGFFTLVIFSLILGIPTLMSLQQQDFDVPVPKVENALMFDAGSHIPLSWKEYYIFDQNQINHLNGIQKNQILNLFPLAFGSQQIIFDEGDVTQYRGNVGTSTTGVTCPISTSALPASAIGTTQGFNVIMVDSDVSSVCDISIARWTVGDSNSPLIPVFFHDYIDEFYVIEDIPDETDVNSGSGSATCLVGGISSAGLNTAINITSAYNTGLFASFVGGNVRCDPANTQNPMGWADNANNDFNTSMSFNPTFYEASMSASNRFSTSKVVTGDSLLIGWLINAPEDKNIPFWMQQVHPKFSTKDLTSATYFLDGNTFSMNTGSIAGDNTQKGQAVIFKEFNKNDLISGGWDFTTITFSQSTDVAVQDIEPYGIFFKPDGRKMYLVGDDGNDISEYSLSTAWDISTKTFTGSKDVSAQTTAPRDVSFSPQGNKMYVMSTTAIYEYTLSTPFLVSSASFIGSAGISGDGMYMRDDGRKLFVINTSADLVIEYDLATAFSVSTLTFVKSKSVSSATTSALDVFFKEDGKKMYFMEDSGGSDNIDRWDLSTAWDVSTASFVSTTIDLDSNDATQRMFFIKPDGLRVYTVGSTNDDIYQYNLTPSSIGNLDVRVTGNMQAFDSASNMWLRIEAKDGEYHTQNVTSFRVNDRELYQGGGSLGVMHLTPTLSQTNFDAKLDFDWSRSTQDIVTIFIGIDDNSTAGRMVADIQSFEIDDEVKYDFTSVNYINNYPQTGSADMSDACGECEDNLGGSLSASHDFETIDPLSAKYKGEGTRAWYNSGITNVTNYFNSTWQWREHDTGAFTPAFTFLREGANPSRIQIDSSSGSIGSGYVFKSFNKADITGSNISVTLQPASAFGMAIEILDGAYEASSSTDFPTNFGRLSKGAGVLNSTFVSAGGGQQTITIPASSINYAGSTQNYITVFITPFDSNSGVAGTWYVKDITISTIGMFDFTPVTYQEIVTGGTGDYGNFFADTVDLQNYPIISAPALPTPQAISSAIATTGTGSGRINLDWVHNELNVTGYEIKIRQPTTGQFISFMNITDAKSSVTITNLASGEPYIFQVCNPRNANVVNTGCVTSNSATASGTKLQNSLLRMWIPEFTETQVKGTPSLGSNCEHNPSALFGSVGSKGIYLPSTTTNDPCVGTVLITSNVPFHHDLDSLIQSSVLFATNLGLPSGLSFTVALVDNFVLTTAETAWQDLNNGFFGAVSNISWLSTGNSVSTSDFISKWDGANYALGLFPQNANGTRSGSSPQVDGDQWQLQQRITYTYSDNSKLWDGKTFGAGSGSQWGQSNSCGFTPSTTYLSIQGDGNDSCIILKVFNKLNLTNNNIIIQANASSLSTGRHFFKLFDGAYTSQGHFPSTFGSSGNVAYQGGGLLAGVEKTSPYSGTTTLVPNWSLSTQPYVTLMIGINGSSSLNPMRLDSVNNGFRIWDFGTDSRTAGGDSASAYTTTTESYIILTNSTFEAVPNVITNLSTTPVGTQCNLSWTAPTANPVITGYTILRKVDGGSFVTLVANTGTTATTYSDTGLVVNGEYFYDVRAINSFGTASGSNIPPACIPQPTSPPSPPTNLQLNNIGTDIQLTWTASASGSPTGYMIERKVNGGAFMVLVANTGTTSTTYLDTTVDPAVEYAYRVSGINSFGTSTPSNEQTILALNTPNIPTLTAQQVGNQISLSWTQPTSDSPINGYKIERRVNGGAFSVLVANTTTTALTYNDLAVSKPNTYGYRVSALSIIGTGDLSNVVDVVFGSHVVVQVREQDGSFFMGGGQVKIFNSTYTNSVQLNSQSNAIFDNLAVGNFNFTFIDLDNFILNKTINFPFPSGNNTSTLTINALVFDTDCPRNGVGTDVRIKLNYTDLQRISAFPSVPVCDSSDKVSWSTRWTGNTGTDQTKMVADFISTIFRANAENFLKSTVPVPTSYSTSLNRIISNEFNITTASDVTINFDLFLGQAPAGGGGGSSGTGSSSAPVESGQNAIPATKIIIQNQLTGLSVLSRTHQFAKAGDVIQGTITVQWEGESPLTMTNVDVGEFGDIIRFDLPPLRLDQRIEGIGEFAKSEADIPYTIVLPPNYCSDELGITQNCVKEELLKLPLAFEFDFEGTKYEASTDVFVDLRPIPFDIVQFQVILLGVGLIVSAIAGNAIRKRLRPEARQKSKTRKKFKKKFDAS